jgi:two-component system heavy metal sensor histidine kinase CusS
MAVLDRAFHVLLGRLDDALATVEAGRAEHLELQLARARELRTLEILIACAVILIVCLVAFYGSYIGRTMRANETLRAQMLDEVAAARDRLQHYANDVSHELRGPISKMRLDAEVLLRHDRTGEQYKDGIESILVETQRLTSIVESLLFLARAENTQVSLQPAPLNAQKELALIVEFFAAAAEKNGISLSVRPARGVIWADRALFQRAVSNLVSNALAHVGPGGGVAISVRAEAAAAIVEVADTGPGIAPDLLARVFDRFQRGDASGSGLGLGLAITKSIMELHGGSIELTSPPGAGVTARLRFPKRAAPKDATATAPERAHA